MAAAGASERQLSLAKSDDARDGYTDKGLPVVVPHTPALRESPHAIQHAHPHATELHRRSSRAATAAFRASANALLAILVGIEVVLLGLWTALGGGDNVVGIFKKILHIGAWVWIVQSYPTLCKDVRRIARASGAYGRRGRRRQPAHGSVAPGRIRPRRDRAAHPKLADLGMTDLSDLIVFGFGYLAIMACFLIMAINVFLAVLEYYLFAALVGIFLPFGLLAPDQVSRRKGRGRRRLRVA